MLKIAVCDDISDCLESISGLVKSWKDKDISITSYDNGYSLTEAHAISPYDIIILDVIMPGINGIEIAAEIRKYDKAVKLLFVTSSSEFAVDSYTVKADGYLLKPVDSDKLIAYLNEFSSQINEHSKALVIKGTTAVHRIELRSIVYAEAQGKLVVFYLTDGRIIKSTEPLYYFEQKLIAEDGFFKCHRSYLVNIHCICSYTPKAVTVLSGAEIPVSRSYHKDFETAYFETVFGKAGEN